MRWGTLLMATGMLAQTGCLLTRNVAHNLANESVEQWDERKLSRQLRGEARAAWEAYRVQSGGALTSDFADGFRDGYADYLESGGNGCPPAVPPLRYRRSGYLSPEGHAQIREYFAGFKTGLDSAAASGRRQFLTVPTLLSDSAAPGTPPGTQIPAAGAPLRVGEQLPSPRRMDPTTGLPIPERPLAEPPPTPPLPRPDKLPDPPPPKLPDPPPAPRSELDARPDVTPVVAQTRAPPPAWPAVRRKTAPPEVPIPGRRVIERN
jgi:hypothetical protein